MIVRWPVAWLSGGTFVFVGGVFASTSRGRAPAAWSHLHRREVAAATTADHSSGRRGLALCSPSKDDELS